MPMFFPSVAPGSSPTFGTVSSTNLNATNNVTANNESIVANANIGTINTTSVDQSSAAVLPIGPTTATGVQVGKSGGTVGLYGATAVARAAAIGAPNTQTASYVQADVQSIVTAVNAIRTALTNLGVTS